MAQVIQESPTMAHRILFEGTAQEFELYKKNSRISGEIRIVVIGDDEQQEEAAHQQLDTLLNDFKKFGGFTKQEANELRTHTQEFRENFDI